MDWFEQYNTGDLLWLGDWGVGWILALFVLGVCILGLSAYDLWSMRPARRWSLLGLRAMVYLIAVLMLLEPALDLKHVSRVKNHIAVLVDKSSSMKLKTSQGQEESRDDVSKKALGAISGQLEAAKEDHQVHYISFGEKARRTSKDGLMIQEASEPASGLSEALLGLKETLGQEDLGGVVLISDGIDTGEIGKRTKRQESLDETSVGRLAALNTPVNTIATSRASSLKDLAISRVLRDDFAFVHNKTSVKVEVQAIGIKEGEMVPVSLYRDGALLGTKQVRVTPKKTRYEVAFEFVPQKLGKEAYMVSVPKLEGEALYENNSTYFLLKIIRDKIRVLQVVGQPSWDERFLRRLLKRNPNIDLISFFILRTDRSVQYAAQNELSLIPFPTRELFEDELGSFDLIVFQNFNFGPYSMRQYLPKIAKFVTDGGGFVMVGGELSFANGGYGGTALEETLPVKLPPTQFPLGAGAKLIDQAHFSPKLTSAGNRHPITQLAFDPGTNKTLWKQLPKQRGTNLVHQAKPDATVLLEHPSVKGVDGKAMPVLTVSEKGEGRVMALTTDSSWRWGFQSLGQGGTLREYQLFWSNAMRWLIKDPELKLLRLDLAQDRYLPGEQVSPGVRVYTPDYKPSPNQEGVLEITRRPLQSVAGGELGKALEKPALEVLKFKTDASGKALVSWSAAKAGIYTIKAVVKRKGGVLEDETRVLVGPDVSEWRDVIPRDRLMAEVAKVTGGSVQVGGDPSGERLLFRKATSVKINRRRVIGIWDSAWCFLLILLILGVEWSLRRRWGRL